MQKIYLKTKLIVPDKKFLAIIEIYNWDRLSNKSVNEDILVRLYEKNELNFLDSYQTKFKLLLS